MISGRVAVKTVETKLGCFCPWGGLDLLESQFDRVNRMGALRAKAECGGGDRVRGERETTTKAQSAPLAQRVQGRDEELQE